MANPVWPALLILLSAAATVVLVLNQKLLMVTIVSLGWVVAVWKLLHFLESGFLHIRSTDIRKLLAAFLSALLSFGLYFVLTALFGQTMFAINQTAWLLLAGLLFTALSIFEALDWVLRHLGRGSMGPGGRIAFLLIIGVVFLAVLFGPLGWSLDRLPLIFGTSVYGEMIDPVVDPFGDAASYAWNSITRNENFVRIQCVMEHGGPTGVAFTRSTAISNCVENKLGRNATPPSEAVTEPVEMRMEDGDFVIEPFRSGSGDSINLRVGIPLHNTLVHDRNGVPIEIPAENVEVSVQWLFGFSQRVEEAADEDVGNVPSGATRVVNFGDDRAFNTFPITNESLTNDQIQQRLIAYTDCKENLRSQQESSGGSEDSGDGESIEEKCGKSWFSGVGDGRLGFIVFRTNEVDREEVSELNPGPVRLAPGRTYNVRVGVTYEYSTEAAFTDSSRWKSANHLLEVWDLQAWNNMSFEERQAWEERKCGSVKRFGQEFRRQRTASLTTPVMPVMSAECGAQLFRQVEKDGEAEIFITASQNTDNTQLKQPLRNGWVEILETKTDCAPGESDTVDLSAIEGKRFTHEPGRGWNFTTGKVERSVEVEGSSKSIACKTDMRFRIHYTVMKQYQVPRIR